MSTEHRLAGRLVCGTSSYPYLLMRRLDSAREQIAQRRPLAAVALDAGFADQAHFSRIFKATFGLTPARYRALRLPAQRADLGGRGQPRHVAPVRGRRRTPTLRNALHSSASNSADGHQTERGAC